MKPWTTHLLNNLLMLYAFFFSSDFLLSISGSLEVSEFADESDTLNFPHSSMSQFKPLVGQTRKSNRGHHKLFTAQNALVRWFIRLATPHHLGYQWCYTVCSYWVDGIILPCTEIECISFALICLAFDHIGKQQLYKINKLVLLEAVI